MIIVNKANGYVVAAEAQEAADFFSRLLGLLGTRCLRPQQALIIRPCSSVHTFGMAYAIDVVFVDAHNCVKKIAADLRPGRMAWCAGSAYVIELPAGTAAQAGLAVGHQLSITASQTRPTP